MTLRRRLLFALFSLALTFGVFGAGVVAVQRHYLIGQVDAQLAGYASSPRLVIGLSGTDRAQVALSEVYVGRLFADGRLVTVFSPTDDPDLLPAVGKGDVLSQPEGRGTTAGQARGVRVVTAPLRTDVQAVFAMPTTQVDQAIAQLAATLTAGGFAVLGVVGLVIWWTYRLGLKPFADLTAAARAITRGERRRRVTPGPSGTEANELARAFNTMLDANQASEERMRRFVADASHELRTPLTTLTGYSSLYTRPATAEGAYGLVDTQGIGDAMRRINAEATRMTRIVNDLFLLNELDAGAAGVGGEVDLGAVLRDVAADIKVIQPERPVQVEAGDGLIVTGDQDRLVQAVTAFTSNALRYTPVTAALTIRGFKVGKQRVRVEVSDGGPGIAAGELPHLYDRFYRADPGRGRGSGGSGLGLAIVAAIVGAHRGQYGVSSVPGQGSVFWFELPT